MDKKTILAFALSFAVLLGWSVFFGTKTDQTQQKQVPPAVKGTEGVARPLEETTPPLSPLPQVTETAVTEKPLQVSEKEIRVETPLYEAVFSNVGPTLRSFKLKKYRETMEPDSPPVEMVSIKKGMGDSRLFNFSTSTGGSELPIAYQADRESINLLPGSSPQSLQFRSLNPSGLLITQVFRFYPGQYKIEVEVHVENRSQHPAEGEFQSHLEALPSKGKKSYYAYIGLMGLINGKLEKVKLKKESEEKLLTGKVGWFAYENGYFMSAVVPEKPVDASFEGRMGKSGALYGKLQSPPVKLAPLDKASSRYILYIGPHDLIILKKLGKDLDKAVNFGWTDIIARPLLYLLLFFNRFIHNYGVSIILLTILIKILFWPLTHKSYKSMKEMQKLQPRLAKLREKYKGNKEQLNKEMMGLYKTYKVNPMGGCLPMVIQIPVFFALYRILGDSIELRHAPFMLWINDLSAPDRLFHFGFKIPFMSPPYGIPVLTLLMGASMFIQQKMTPTPGDPSQAKLMMFLPIVFTVMFINFPSGLVLYWLVNNILSIGQQYRIHKGA
ncbi:MAG: membrane protein insertase YidC [Desulfatiglandaceae bacterium]|jgi:YidC/Oxa1 family membrane protein insertase